MSEQIPDNPVTDEELLALAQDGEVPCVRALEFAERKGLSPADVGQRLTELDIKIVACQLGCFGKHRADRLSKQPSG